MDEVAISHNLSVWVDSIVVFGFCYIDLWKKKTRGFIGGNHYFLYFFDIGSLWYSIGNSGVLFLPIWLGGLLEALLVTFNNKTLKATTQLPAYHTPLQNS